MLDAPVSGRPPGMTVMVGGDEPVFARCRPLFEAIAHNIFYVGAAGAGCIAKLVTQYLGYTNFVAALEGLLIGAKAGVDPGILAQIVPFSAGASRTFDNIPRSVLSRRLHRRRHPRHRRQGSAPRLRTRPRGRRALKSRPPRPRHLAPRAGAGLGPGRLSGRRSHPGGDGRLRIAFATGPGRSPISGARSAPLGRRQSPRQRQSATAMSARRVPATLPGPVPRRLFHLFLSGRNQAASIPATTIRTRVNTTITANLPFEYGN